MRKRLVLITLFVCAFFIVHAQNANRSGFFVEAGVGGVTGDRPVTNLDERDDVIESGEFIGENFVTIKVERKKKAFYGLGFNAAAGYRWHIARHFAADAKVKFNDATYRFKETSQIDVMLGLRYMSHDFGGNKSIYANAGIGAGFFPDESTFCLPYEVGAGINFSNHFYAGLIWDAQVSFADKFIYGKNYGIIGIKAGFRF